jgi:hypothetical protein
MNNLVEKLSFRRVNSEVRVIVKWILRIQAVVTWTEMQGKVIT